MNGQDIDKLIPVLSLVVAALAVFVGPIISLRIARRQVVSSLEVANKQIIAPMRQAWINSLRDMLSELSSSALHYFVAGFEDRTDEEYLRLTLLEHKVRLMLNPKEEDHRTLEKLIRTMVGSLQSRQGSESDRNFIAAYEDEIALSREVLKREWDRVKAPLELS